MERANSTDVRKDLFGQIHVIVYQSFKQTAVTAVWNTERDDPELRAVINYCYYSSGKEAGEGNGFNRLCFKLLFFSWTAEENSQIQ